MLMQRPTLGWLIRDEQVLLLLLHFSYDYSFVCFGPVPLGGVTVAILSETHSPHQTGWQEEVTRADRFIAEKVTHLARMLQ